MFYRMLLRVFVFTLGMGAVLFLCAGTIAWAGGWIFIAVMLGGGLAMTLWLNANDPDLLANRINQRNPNKGKADRLLPLLNIFFFVWLVAMAVDVRWHSPTQMPLWVNIAGGVAAFAAFLACIKVFRENTFATAAVKIQPERGHRVIDTGPYAHVRHPLYSAALAAYFALPFGMGSWRGLAGVPVLVLLIALRARWEEDMLKAELAGYCDYMTKVRYRFVPGLW